MKVEAGWFHINGGWVTFFVHEDVRKEEIALVVYEPIYFREKP